MITYICVGSFICPRAGECDKFMAPLVNHKTANCRVRKEEENQRDEKRVPEKQKNREIHRQMGKTDKEKKRKKESETWLKSSVLSLTDAYTDSKEEMQI